MNASPAARTDDDWERVRERRLRRRSRRVWGRRAVNAFLVWHCFAVFVWLVPNQWAIVQLLVPQDNAGPIRPYLMGTGFQQTWQMFSPNPANSDLFLTAQVTYRDGQQRTFAFPRTKDMGWAERYRRERWRKLEEVANGDASLWPALAGYAVRTLPHAPGNPPVFVTLTRHARPVPPPGETWKPFTEDLFYRANVPTDRANAPTPEAR